MLSVLAQHARPGFWGWGFGEMAIAVVVIAAVLGLVWIALRQFGIAIPSWAAQVGWILVVAFIVILAIRLVMSM